MNTLTVTQCKRIAAGRKSDHWGNIDPFKGRCWSFGLSGDEQLPDGYAFINVPTWGLHLVDNNKGRC